MSIPCNHIAVWNSNTIIPGSRDSTDSPRWCSSNKLLATTHRHIPSVWQGTQERDLRCVNPALLWEQDLKILHQVVCLTWSGFSSSSSNHQKPLFRKMEDSRVSTAGAGVSPVPRSSNQTQKLLETGSPNPSSSFQYQQSVNSRRDSELGCVWSQKTQWTNSGVYTPESTTHCVNEMCPWTS